ncbi:MAG: hypothetical protein VR74_02920 [Hyphomonas sp. BRH_c22]|nr:MAG: hypothetical protein VR74_02920 [Hyphomonas sp. BRH_c22]
MSCPLLFQRLSSAFAQRVKAGRIAKAVADVVFLAATLRSVPQPEGIWLKPPGWTGDSRVSLGKGKQNCDARIAKNETRVTNFRD